MTYAAFDGAPYTPIAQKGAVVWGISTDAWEKAGPAPPELAQVRWATPAP